VTDWAKERARFPVLGRVAYLNAGTFGPLAQSTVDTAVDEQRRLALEGRSGPAFVERMNALRDGARRRAAEQLAVEPDRIALTTSTTDGCNVVVAGLRLGPADEIVTTDSEHFGLLGPLITSGARVRVARIGEATGRRAVELLLDEVTPRTRLLAVSHVSWITGHALDLALLRDETRVPLLVDGAQSVGAIPVDSTVADFYTVSGQKWLCGPEATGALFVADPESLGIARPSYFAQRKHDRLAATFEPAPGAGRFDTGWTPLPSLAGLVAALADLPEGRFERAAELAARCRELLAARYDVVTEPGHATLVSFRAAEASALPKRLAEAGVVVRDLPGTRLVRVSCGWWNDEADLERLTAALDGAYPKV
jgi:selenocysteine lyase/cysteine desulfurase